jgi:hypothetical protein
MVRWIEGRGSDRAPHGRVQSSLETVVAPILLLCIVWGWKYRNRTCYLVGCVPIGILATAWWMYMDKMGCSVVPGWVGPLLYLQLTALLWLPDR